MTERVQRDAKERRGERPDIDAILVSMNWSQRLEEARIKRQAVLAAKRTQASPKPTKPWEEEQAAPVPLLPSEDTAAPVAIVAEPALRILPPEPGRNRWVPVRGIAAVCAAALLGTAAYGGLAWMEAREFARTDLPNPTLPFGAGPDSAVMMAGFAPVGGTDTAPRVEVASAAVAREAGPDLPETPVADASPDPLPRLAAVQPWMANAPIAPPPPGAAAGGVRLAALDAPNWAIPAARLSATSRDPVARAAVPLGGVSLLLDVQPLAATAPADRPPLRAPFEDRRIASLSALFLTQPSLGVAAMAPDLPAAPSVALAYPDPGFADYPVGDVTKSLALLDMPETGHAALPLAQPTDRDTALALPQPPANATWDNVTVHIHGPTGLGATDLAAAEALVVNAGFATRLNAGMPHSISTSHIRYFHADDRNAAEKLAAGFGAELRDFTNFNPAPKTGTLELWLAGRGAPKAPVALPVPTVKTQQLAVARQPVPTRITRERRGVLGRFFDRIGGNSEPAALMRARRGDDQGDNRVRNGATFAAAPSPAPSAPAAPAPITAAPTAPTPAATPTSGSGGTPGAAPSPSPSPSGGSGSGTGSTPSASPSPSAPSSGSGTSSPGTSNDDDEDDGSDDDDDNDDDDNSGSSGPGNSGSSNGRGRGVNN